MPIQYATADNFRIITREQLERILDVLASVSWPCSEDQIPYIIDRLGWVITSQRVHVMADTRLGFNYALGDFSRPNGEFTRLSAPVSDTVDDADPIAGKCVGKNFSTIESYVGSILGTEPTRSGSLPSQSWWELPTGGRIRLENISVGLEIGLLSRQIADVERYVETHDMSDYEDE